MCLDQKVFAFDVLNPTKELVFDGAGSSSWDGIGRS